MKKLPLLTLAFTALCLASVHAENPQINVSGSAEVNVTPDEVYISAAVETRDSQLDTAIHQNNEHVASALAFLKSAGIPAKDIQTDCIQVRPDYGSSDSQIEPRFYQVRKSIGVKLGAITNLEAVVSGLMSHGANVLDNIDLRTTDLRKYRDQAREMAIRAAKEKAVALCGALDAKCGKPLNISAQEYGGYYSWPGNRWGFGSFGANSFANNVQNVAQVNSGAGEADGQTTSIGQISVSATVNVTFAIQ